MLFLARNACREMCLKHLKRVVFNRGGWHQRGERRKPSGGIGTARVEKQALEPFTIKHNVVPLFGDQRPRF